MITTDELRRNSARLNLSAPDTRSMSGEGIVEDERGDLIEEDEEDDEPVTAADSAEVADLVARMAAIAKGGILDEDAAAAMLAAAWVDGASGKKVEAAFNPNQPRDPGGEGGGQWTTEGTSGNAGGMKVRAVKNGVKIDGVIYNRENPAPPELALEAARKLGTEPALFSAALYNMGHREWEKTVPGAMPALEAIRARTLAALASERDSKAAVAKAITEKLGVDEETAVEIAKDNTAYTFARGVTVENLVFRGEEESPVFKAARDTLRGDTSRISKSTYPEIEIELSNGAKFIEKIRVSDHDQVSSNAPRFYSYDYRAKSVKEALRLPEFMEDMEALAEDVWNRQRQEWERLKK